MEKHLRVSSCGWKATTRNREAHRALQWHAIFIRIPLFSCELQFEGQDSPRRSGISFEVCAPSNHMTLLRWILSHHLRLSCRSFPNTSQYSGKKIIWDLASADPSSIAVGKGNATQQTFEALWMCPNTTDSFRTRTLRGRCYQFMGNPTTEGFGRKLKSTSVLHRRWRPLH